MGLKDFFFETSAEESKPVPKMFGNTTTPAAMSGVVTPSFSPNQEFEKFRAHFDQLFEQSNLPGPDYFEFSKMVDSMGTAIPIDTRIIAAFNGLKIQGLTREKLLNTAQEYLKILEADSVNFTAKVNDEIQSKKKAAEDMQRLIEQKKAAVEQLQKEIADQTVALNEFNSVEGKMGEKVANYQSALSQMKTKITEDIAKINLIQ
jgi:hypothetical protein